MGQATQGVGLVHELAQLGGAEELLQRGDDRADVDDRLRRDRVRILGCEALADDALHPVQTDPERLLDQLTDRPQTAVAEVLVLVQVLLDGLARARHGLGGVVLEVLVELLGDTEDVRQTDELADQREDVVVRERPDVEVDVQAETAVELVAADAREVVALGIEEQLVQQRASVVHRRRLARTLLLEQLDQRALLRARDLRVGVDRVADVEAVVEELQDLFVGRVAHRAQEHRDRQLALAIDPDVDPALLVDLQLQPRTAGRHQIRDEDLLLRILGLHQVGARGAHQLRHHHALGAVDDERAALGHPREIAHEHRLLADLARLAIDEADRHRQRPRVREVLLTTLIQAGHRIVERELPELHGQVAGVVLDRRDVVDRLAQPAPLRIDKPGKGLLLDVDQVRDIDRLVETRESTARAGSINSSQDGDSSGSSRATGEVRRTCRGHTGATSQDSTGGCGPPGEGRSALTDPARPGSRMWREGHCGRLRLSAEWHQDSGKVNRALSKPGPVTR